MLRQQFYVWLRSKLFAKQYADMHALYGDSARPAGPDVSARSQLTQMTDSLNTAAVAVSDSLAAASASVTDTIAAATEAATGAVAASVNAVSAAAAAAPTIGEPTAVHASAASA